MVSQLDYTLTTDTTLYAQWYQTPANIIDQTFATATGPPLAVTISGLDLSVLSTRDALSSALASASTNVSLNLSGCTDITVWNSSTLSNGKDKIVSLVLPDTVETIDAIGGYTYSNLTTMSGEGVTTIGDSAFYECTSLTSGYYEHIMSIGVDAFKRCTALTTVNLQNVTFIGYRTFTAQRSLAHLTLPAIPPTLEMESSNAGVFTNTNDDPGAMLEIHVGAGNIGAYLSAWNVSQQTAANGNQAVYGGPHKAINIVD